MLIEPVTCLKGTLAIPGDKSISHRSIMFGSLAKGETTLFNFLMGDDCLSTIRCFRQLGIQIDCEENKIVVHGKGLYGLSTPSDVLDCGNSGTTVRLMSGILCGQSFTSTVTGDASIQKRPMNRIISPLSQMGASIEGTDDRGLCPLSINPSRLRGIAYSSPVASAQVKSSVLLAGLYAGTPTSVTEPHISRDHTERMLTSFGATLTREGTCISINPPKELFGQTLTIPGDISSAAFFMVAGLIVPNSEITLKNVGINPTRRGILDVLLEMGGDITCFNKKIVCNEPVCDMTIRSSTLKGITIGGHVIPTLIDEIPALAVAACFAQGTTVIKDASELKVKESNRIDAIYIELTKMGAKITPTEDGMLVEGITSLNGALVESYHDHRMAMSLAVAALVATTPTTILHSECVSISFPNFYSMLQSLNLNF